MQHKGAYVDAEGFPVRLCAHSLWLGKVVVVPLVVLSLGVALWSFPAVQRPLHTWHAASQAEGMPSTSSFCGTPSAAGATGATGTLFSGTKQRTYAGARVASQQAGAGLPLGQSSPAPQPQAAARNWAVVTTINPPTDAILDVAALPGWSIVIVGDTSTPQYNISQPNVHFLSAADQKQLAAPYADFTALLPWRHFGRKNLGYLYAVLHGAAAVWDFDDDNALKPGQTPQVPSAGVYQVKVLDARACAAFNPYPRMGGPSAVDPVVPPSWPRGFPLDLIRTPCPHRLVPGNVSKVAVLQSLADHDPDVDAIYRLTRGVPFSFAPSSRDTLVLPDGGLAPWNAQATLVLQPALWGLLLPVTVHGRVSDIWRSYIVQRLLWDVGYSVAFSPPLVVQNRGPHNYLADMQAEADLYAKASQLVQFLRSWRGMAPSIAGRYEELMIELYERGYVQMQDVQLAQQWLKALMAGGYRFPDLVSNTGWQEQQQQEEQQPQQHPADAMQQQPKQQPLAPGPKATPGSTQSAWAVLLSSAASPTAAVRRLAGLPGWQVVVVADGRGAARSSTQAWTLPNVTYLDEEQQYALPYQVLKHLPPSSYSRKVLGYLYAISRGAALLYDADDSIELLQGSVHMLSCTSTSPELVPARPGSSAACQGPLTLLKPGSAQPQLFNPHPLFGQPHVCPRGIHPAQLQQQNASVCFQRALARPLIQAGLINGRPDVDSSYHGNQAMDVAFERSAFSVVLPHQVAAPVNSLNTLYMQDAFWALLLPVSTQPGTGDIWRGLWAQRLLREIGGHLALLPATAARTVDPGHDGSTGQSTLPSLQAAHAATVWGELAGLQLKAQDLPGRMLEAAQDMADHSHLQPRDIALLQAWIADLRALGYTFPALGAPAVQQVPSSAAALSAASWMTDDPLDGAFLFPQQWCTRLDTALVVNFNRIGDDKLKRQMRLLHAVYRPHFRRVLMAGSEGPNWVQPNPRLQGLMDQGYFLNCGNHSIRAPDVGFFTYACAAEGLLAAQQAVWRPDHQPEPVNMFYINDDIVYSPCMAQRLDHSKVWYPSPLSDLKNLTDNQGWWWDSDMSSRTTTLRQATINTFTSLWGSMAALGTGRAQPVRVTRDQNQGDIYYVPARYMQLFAKVAAHFQSHWVMSEVAVPNMLSLLVAGPQDVEVVGFSMSWGGGRECIEKGIQKVLPLGANISQADVQACGPNLWPDAQHTQRAGLFAMHPVKMSVASVSDRWLAWWLSQTCMSS